MIHNNLVYYLNNGKDKIRIGLSNNNKREERIGLFNSHTCSVEVIAKFDNCYKPHEVITT